MVGQPTEAEGKVEDGSELKKEEENKEPFGKNKFIADVVEHEEGKI